MEKRLKDCRGHVILCTSAASRFRLGYVTIAGWVCWAGVSYDSGHDGRIGRCECRGEDRVR